jgi:hypothetical protein
MHVAEQHDEVHVRTNMLRRGVNVAQLQCIGWTPLALFFFISSRFPVSFTNIFRQLHVFAPIVHHVLNYS